MVRKKTDDSLRVLMALRSALNKADQALSDAYPLACDTKVVAVSGSVDEAQRLISEALMVLENHWPTIDPSGRCQGCERCKGSGVN